MGYMIIEEQKSDELLEHAKKVLKHGKKLYECIEELAEESSMGERGGGYGSRGGRYGNRGGGGGYGNRMGYRDEEDWEDDDDPYMGERRGRSSHTGRYVRR